MVFARAVHKRPSATLAGKPPAGVANDWVTPRSPSLLRRRAWRLNVQSGQHDPGNNTPGIVLSVGSLELKRNQREALILPIIIIIVRLG
jgi:hypothetical protein